MLYACSKWWSRVKVVPKSFVQIWVLLLFSVLNWHCVSQTVCFSLRERERGRFILLVRIARPQHTHKQWRMLVFRWQVNFMQPHYTVFSVYRANAAPNNVNNKCKNQFGSGPSARFFFVMTVNHWCGCYCCRQENQSGANNDRNQLVHVGFNCFNYFQMGST